MGGGVPLSWVLFWVRIAMPVACCLQRELHCFWFPSRGLVGGLWVLLLMVGLGVVVGSFSTGGGGKQR